MPLIFICMARTVGMVLFLPVLSGNPASNNLIKSAIALVISSPVIMQYSQHAEFLGLASLPLTLLVMKEVFIGACIGFSAAIPFWAIEIAGFLIDTMRGSTMAELFNAMLQSQTSVLGSLFSLVITVLFLSMGGMEILLEALYSSYTTISIMPIRLNLSPQFIDFFTKDMQLIFTMAMVFALPAMLIMLITDIFLGIINVSAKDLNVFSISMSVKSLFAIFLIIISINYSIPYYLENMYRADMKVHYMVEKLK